MNMYFGFVIELPLFKFVQMKSSSIASSPVCSSNAVRSFEMFMSSAVRCFFHSNIVQ